MYNRLIEVHGENPNTDYMLKMKNILSSQKMVEDWQKVWSNNSGPNLNQPSEKTKRGVLEKWESLGFSIGDNKNIEINTDLTNEQMLGMIRKDRPTQIINEVISFKPSSLGIKDVQYDVIVSMETDFLGTKIKNTKFKLPYPVKPYQEWFDYRNDGHL